MIQKTLQIYLRSTTMAVFTFLEAYLNGLAYDCFQVKQDDLEVKHHDMLAEWDRLRDRRSESGKE